MNTSTPQLPEIQHTFTQLLSSTRRGARLARLLATEQLRSWPAPPSVTERAEQIVAELAANAVLHGRVQGRGFRLALTLATAARTLRIEVADARGDQLPVPAGKPGTPQESGLGLFLVASLADRWGTEPYPPSGKCVWAEIDLTPGAARNISGQPADEPVAQHDHPA
ncbi:ATP-binding protein [Streptomyces sp. MBT27]|uniref:ATP-binding protein n=1 Tax=Streptomyces sp. MBT27 TaxID=1488356 RepID=UPI001421CE60|nr:ATP-binding protein [Streptomyces sp. MBT27]